MASSRWKRFGFFERSNLNLPPSVLEDVLPPHLFPDANSSNSNSRSRNETLKRSEYINLAVVNGAGLPVACLQNSDRTTSGCGIDGMLSTLFACTKSGSAEEEKSEVFKISNSGQVLSIPSNMRTSKGNVEGSLVLAFVSSRFSSLLHCVDLTVRCNPISSKSINQSKQSSFTRDGVQGKAKSSQSTELEDLDGWRGCFQPFAHDIMNDSLQNEEGTVTQPPQPNSKVTAVAVCTDHGTYVIKGGKNIYVACISESENSVGISVHRNPHLYLNDVDGSSTKPKVTPKSEVYQPLGKFDSKHRGRPCCVDISHTSGIVAVGTDIGLIVLYDLLGSRGNNKTGSNGTNKLTFLTEIPPPVSSGNNGCAVSCLRLISEDPTKEQDTVGNANNGKSKKRSKLFVTYRRTNNNLALSNSNPVEETAPHGSITKGIGSGVCSYDLGNVELLASKSSPSAYDLDGREVLSSCLCDIVRSGGDVSNVNLVVGRSDGVYSYSSMDKVSVSPIDGTKITMCTVPPPPIARRSLEAQWVNPDGNEHSLQEDTSGFSYILIATTDGKSRRDAVDIYDASNKLVAFHLLLSPGHQALLSAGVTTTHRFISDGNVRGGLSSAIVLTTGGSMITLTEKMTTEKVSLLVQKNLYSAAISMAFADSSFQALDIASLYRKYAEHLYRKGDFAAAMEQYIYTIGSLEPSHVIFRFLDAPKIPLLAKYLEELRSRELATNAQNELLRSCYLKLNDTSAAEKIAGTLSKTMDVSCRISLVTNLLHNPTEALATLCSFEAPLAVEALIKHGVTLVRALPRETAGIVVSLCDGTYEPSVSSSSNLSESFRNRRKEGDLVERFEANLNKPSACEKYPMELFSPGFAENPKLLRLILAHCFRNKFVLNQSLKRTLLELTLEEWNSAKRSQNSRLKEARRSEAISLLTDPNSGEESDYEALIIVESAGFVEGEVLLLEKLQMTSLLIDRYAQDGCYKARRQMLALCKSDPELIADVLGHLVKMAAEKLHGEHNDDTSINSESEVGELLEDIKEALSMARLQGVLPPVRVTRILSGEGVGQFCNEYKNLGSDYNDSVPLSVALDYIGAVLDDSSNAVERLKNEVQEYSSMCTSMETEIKTLLGKTAGGTSSGPIHSDINIDEMYSSLLEGTHGKTRTEERKTEVSSEEFWRELRQSDETIARFFAKDVID